ncbi:hypothetical protein [Novosphingobium sp. FKTRR1]|uniref:hypothetical protein n=1 Tax=Novosphingobium sp. FKTRR1 TaxID=2879118 RepID=UPI001CF0899C|nr:hypothetical protein [Novosphingobium sp. FKTRR1]
MDDEPFNPDNDLIFFALAGMIKGWCEVMEPQNGRGGALTSFGVMRLWVIVAMAWWVINSHIGGMAWASVLHFVLKDLGTYQAVRMVSWAVVMGLAKFHVIRPPRDGARSNP